MEAEEFGFESQEMKRGVKRGVKARRTGETDIKSDSRHEEKAQDHKSAEDIRHEGETYEAQDKDNHQTPDASV